MNTDLCIDMCVCSVVLEQQQLRKSDEAKLSREQNTDRTKDSALIAENIDPSNKDSVSKTGDSIAPTKDNNKDKTGDSTLSTENKVPSAEDSAPLSQDHTLPNNDKDTQYDTTGTSHTEQQPTKDSAAQDSTEKDSKDAGGQKETPEPEDGERFVQYSIMLIIECCIGQINTKLA